MQDRNRDDVIEIDLLEVIGYLFRKIWIIIIAGMAAGAIGFSLSAFVITPQYESTTKIYVLNKQNNAQVTYSDTQLASQLTKDYAELIRSRYVLEKVIEMCALNDDYDGLYDRVSVEHKTDTRIIGITIKDPNPAVAQFIADSVRDVASEHIQSVTDVEAVNIVDMANLPVEPSEPSVLKWTAIGMAVGVMLAVLVLFVMFMLDDTIKASEDVDKYLGLSTLALIPIMQGQDLGKTKASSKHKSSNTDENRSVPTVAKKVSDKDTSIKIDEI